MLALPDSSSPMILLFEYYDQRATGCQFAPLSGKNRPDNDVSNVNASKWVTTAGPNNEEPSRCRRSNPISSTFVELSCLEANCCCNKNAAAAAA